MLLSLSACSSHYLLLYPHVNSLFPHDNVLMYPRITVSIRIPMLLHRCHCLYALVNCLYPRVTVFIRLLYCYTSTTVIPPCQLSLSMRYCQYLRVIDSIPMSLSIVTRHCLHQGVTVCICVSLFVSPCQSSVSTCYCLYSRVIVCISLSTVCIHVLLSGYA